MDGVDRGLLRPRVDRGGDLQTLGVEGLLGNPRVRQFAQHLVADQAVGPRRGVGVGGPVGRRGDREFRCTAVLLSEHAHRDHAVEDVVPAGLQLVEVGLGVEVGRALDHGGEHRTLGHRQVADGLVEVGARRRLDAVRAATEVDGVQVGGENLVLGPLAGHLGGDDEFAHLAVHVAVRADQHVLHVLLRDRRPAARAFLAEDVVAGGTHEPGDGEAGVGVEVAVLRRQHGVADVLGNGVERDLGAVALRRDHLGQLGGAVGGEDGGHLIGLHVRRARDLGADVTDQEPDEGDDQQQRDHDQADPADRAPPVALLLPVRWWSGRVSRTVVHGRCAPRIGGMVARRVVARTHFHTPGQLSGHGGSSHPPVRMLCE